MGFHKSFVQAAGFELAWYYLKSEELQRHQNNIIRYIQKYLSGNMLSAANNYTPNGKLETMIIRSIRNLDIIKDSEIYQGIPIYIDSGGFQIINGYISKEHIIKYIDLYYQFLVDQQDKFQWAYLLDIPYSDKVFKGDFKSYVKLNEITYNYYYQLPDSLKKKMIFISHYSNYETYKFFDGLMDQMKYLDNFKIVSVGSLGSDFHKNIDIKIRSMIRPIMSFLKYYQQSKSPTNIIHYLGMGLSSPIIRLIHHLIMVVIKEKFGIDLVIQHDSTVVKHMKFRRVSIYEDKQFEHLSITTRITKDMFRGTTREKYIINCINKMIKEDDIGQITEIPETGNQGKFYLLYMLSTFKMDYQMNVDYEKYAKHLYELYKNQNYQEFSHYFTNILIQKYKITGSKQMNMKIYSLLKMIETIETNNYDYIFEHELKKSSVKSTELLQVD